MSYSSEWQSSTVTPTINEWTESGGAYNAGGITYISANWFVPNAPTNTINTPVTFLFDGIEPDGLAWIVQPVLGWGCCVHTSAGDQGGNFWYITAFYCCPGGGGTGSPIIQVNTGDQIRGYLNYQSQCNGPGSGPGYFISVTDLSIPAYGTWNACTGSTGTQAYLVLENKRVDWCNQLPPGNGVAFSSLSTTPILP